MTFWNVSIKTSEKLQTPALDVYEGKLLLSSLHLFIKILRENSDKKLMEYETNAINMSEEIERNYCDMEKRIVTNFHIIPKAVIHLEEEIFRIEVINSLLDCLIIQLLKRGESYEHNGERLKFLADLTRNTDVDEGNVKLVIRHYKEDIDDKLVNE